MPGDMRCDVAIIGAGTAGLAAERSARRAGATTLLIDPAFSGTTCANVGCMPSKLLIAAAGAAEAVRRAATFGIDATPRVDGPAVMRRLRRERDAFAEGTRAQIERLPAGIRVKAKATFGDGGTLALEDGRRITAKAIVIATGSQPNVPKAFDAIRDFVLTNETVFELDDLPGRLAVIGAGALGLELGQAMARLGVKVTLLDEKDALAGLDDAEIGGMLKAIMARDLELHLGVSIAADTVDGGARLRWSGASSGEARFDRVLVAAGRPPALHGLGLETTGLALDEHGTPEFDRETMRCGNSGIFIAGDVDADRPVLHEASAEGAIAGANAAAFPHVEKARRFVPMSIMFTDPPLAIVGRKAADDLVTGTADYRDQGRARVEARADGMAQLRAAPGDGRLLGATLLCPGADHLGHLLAWSIESGATAGDLLARPFYHPTLEEGLKPALRAICAQVGVKLPAGSDEEGASGA
ncbi:dihydrolipoyl dehydrogenase [Sphingomonas solaris]|uniref:Dihydrolipoyl dehydrogenase n=1 Tax=Alterirhizorhabdus solaris TaxID=2529389 RepID=A0A558R1T2_9SPHN|nr:dihydrolipoyl dehydrogenase [Sphingomonas solaris]TVV73334.1 dihydrolipoyl dehydrogenase [Sphingomonas solaris]